MKTEKDYEELFISCAKKQRGHAFKIKMSTINGLPDMYCAMPGYSPVLLEAKLIKDVGAKFKRTIHYSKLQTELLNNCNKVNPVHTIAFGLIFVKDYMGYDYCMLMEPEIPTITHHDIETIRSKGTVVLYHGGINVLRLFRDVVPILHYNGPIDSAVLSDHENVNSYTAENKL